MIKKIKLLIISALAFGLFAVPAVSLAETPNIEGSLCQGTNLQFGAAQDCAANGDETRLNDLIAKIVNIVSVIVAIVAVIMIIYGGFKYITSGGDSGNVTGAKNTILYAIIGLVIVALAQFIVKFVLGQSSSLVN
jgi:Type IV secretion system pilin